MAGMNICNNNNNTSCPSYRQNRTADTEDLALTYSIEEKLNNYLLKKPLHSGVTEDSGDTRFELCNTCHEKLKDWCIANNFTYDDILKRLY